MRSRGRPLLPLQPHLNSLLIVVTLDDPVHIDAGDVNVLLGEHPHIHDFLHLRGHQKHTILSARKKGPIP